MLPDPKTCEFTTAEALIEARGKEKIHLIDVRTEDAYAECHIPGSTNICIYETDFPNKMADFEPDKTASIVVYGQGAPFKADLAAYASLQSQSYRQVAILEGGLDGWKADGHKTEGAGQPDRTPEFRRYSLDTEKSRLRWVGRNLANQHNGEIRLASGHIEFDDAGQLADGAVTVDMEKMVCHDITDSASAKAPRTCGSRASLQRAANRSPLKSMPCSPRLKMALSSSPYSSSTAPRSARSTDPGKSSSAWACTW